MSRIKASGLSRWLLGCAIGLPAVMGGVYLTNREEVPITHRKRFMMCPKSIETKLAETELEDLLKEYGSKRLPDTHNRHKKIVSLGSRILGGALFKNFEDNDPIHAGVGSASVAQPAEILSYDWEYYVIDSPEVNAFVLSTGKMFVFTGLMDVLQDQDEMAAVLSHEIGHLIARHSAEKLSQLILFTPPLTFLGWLTGMKWIWRMLYQAVVALPSSREHESEADYLGLHLAAHAAFDPRAALRVASRITKEGRGDEKDDGSFQNLFDVYSSSHPSHHQRIVDIEQWMPEVQDAYRRAKQARQDLPSSSSDTSSKRASSSSSFETSSASFSSSSSVLPGVSISSSGYPIIAASVPEGDDINKDNQENRDDYDGMWTLGNESVNYDEEETE